MFSEFMDWMKQMIYLLVFLTLLLQILPNGNYKKYVRFFAGMIFVVTLASPVVSMLTADDLEDTLTETLETELQNFGDAGDGWNADSGNGGDTTGLNEEEIGLDDEDFQSMEETQESMLWDYASEYVEE